MNSSPKPPKHIPPNMPVLDVTPDTASLPPTLQHWSTPLSCNLYVSKVAQTADTITFLVKLVPKGDVKGSCIDSFIVEFYIKEALTYIQKKTFISRMEHIYMCMQEEGAERAKALTEIIPEWGIQ